MRDEPASYDEVKEFEGRKYTGMRVGGSHSWFYGQGEWKETKIAPDKWQFAYAVKKRRKWDAPEGSGAPTGTEYHWYILAHQTVRKLNANEYATSMTGVKYKLAHRRAGSEEWNLRGRAKLRQSISILEENILQLRNELRGVSWESGAACQVEDFPTAKTIQQRREIIGGRRTQSRGMSFGMLGQPPLDTYVAQTGTAAAKAGVSPSEGPCSSVSSKSEFLPKNNR